MKVHITTYPTAHPQRGVSKTINWRDSSDRKWLTNHMHWAMHNQHEVTLVPDSN